MRSKPDAESERQGPRWQEAVFSLVARVSGASSFLARSVEIAGNVAAYTLWQAARDLRAPTFSSREALWRSAMMSRLRQPATVLEFGVATGATTRFWLNRLPNADLRWHGFDVFSGLPAPWSRGGVVYSQAGRFDVGGVPPAIEDPRVTWHVGLVEDTLPGVAVDPGHQLCVLLDLDLYQPTAHVLEWLSGKLRAGDLIYLDEIYDPWNERRALDEFLSAGHVLRPLGSTGMAASFEYLGRTALSEPGDGELIDASGQRQGDGGGDEPRAP